MPDQQKSTRTFSAVNLFIRAFFLAWRAHPPLAALHIVMLFLSAAMGPVQVWMSKVMIDRLSTWLGSEAVSRQSNWQVVMLPLTVYLVIWVVSQAAGIEALARLYGDAHVHVVVGRRERSVLDGLEKLLSGTSRVRLCRVDSRYPQAHPAVLMSSILRREFPHGYSPAHAGVVVLDLQAALHVADAIVDGKPLIDHVIALSGPSFRENIHVRARIGTSLEEVVAGRLKFSTTRQSVCSVGTTSDNEPSTRAPVSSPPTSAIRRHLGSRSACRI